jgi:hypothetical protein
MRKLCAGILALTLAGCASTREARPTSQDTAATEDCTRFDAAARAYGEGFNPIKMQKMAIEDCGRGDAMACIAAPMAIPFTILLGIVSAPVVFPIFMASDNVYRSGCPSPPPTMPVDVTSSDAPLGETALPEEESAGPGGLR